MHQAIPYRSWQSQTIQTNNNDAAFALPLPTTSSSSSSLMTHVSASVSETAAIVFARKGCCMTHVVKRLLLGLGANPAVYEVDDQDELHLLAQLEAIRAAPHAGTATATALQLQLPALFIGGTFFGGLDRVMATHISGDLVPILKQAGALWL